MTAVLYERKRPDHDGLFCEWCGREAEEVPLHVSGSEIELAAPVLCDVCQGLLGLIHPHKHNLIDSKAPDVVAEKQERVWREAKATVCRLLAQRYEAEGRPRPTWAASWPTWPPAPGDSRTQ